MGNSFPSLPRIPVVTGKPFHAEVNARRVQIKPDGSQAVYESHDILARDTDLRVFSEHLASPDLQPHAVVALRLMGPAFSIRSP